MSGRGRGMSEGWALGLARGLAFGLGREWQGDSSRNSLKGNQIRSQLNDMPSFGFKKFNNEGSYDKYIPTKNTKEN